MVRVRSPIVFMAIAALLTLVLVAPRALAGTYCDGSNALPGGTLDPCEIPKYVIPLVIPPVMNNTGTADNYDIAVRQFQQQILPGGIWDILAGTSFGLPATTIWSYGPAADPLPDASLIPGLGALPAGIAPAANSQFNYPAYTIETMSNVPVSVRWRNELKPDFGAGDGWLPHLLPIDQTLHWANPAQIQCKDGGNHTDCRPEGANPAEQADLQATYLGPVPIVTHVHGAHVDPHSDGYPEAWWLPALGADLPAGYASEGTLFDDAFGQARGGNTGYADYLYRQDQPATTLWYHDHSLGMTRSNVYAGPAGFWMVRGGLYDRPRVLGTRMAAKLPSPGPRAGQTVLELNLPTSKIRQKIREIPIAIQARSFNTNGSLFYPDNRDFFEGLAAGTLAGFGVNFSPYSDVAPIWNPEAFFNVMVVNGVAWPKLEVAPALYRLRFLNGNNSRFLILQLVYVEEGADVNDSGNWNQVNGAFWQIGAEQGFLPAPVQLDQLLMGLAERADVIMDFAAIAASIPENSSLYLVNVGPDEPFNGIVETPADPATTGQVMKFVVNSALLQSQDARTTPPDQLDLMAEPALGGLTNPTPRLVSLNEEESESETVCINENEEIVGGPPCDEGEEEVPFGPTAALLGTVTGSGAAATGNPLKWTDPDDPNNVEKQVTLLNGTVLSVNVTENPALNSIEQWEIYNFTVDAHPIHLHLVRFEVVNREIFRDTSPNYTDAGSIGATRDPEGWESGFKDTVIAYPGEITRVKAFFDIEGLYVWHCHIVEHEDNEMMRPYAVGLPTVVPAVAPIPMGFGGIL